MARSRTRSQIQRFRHVPQIYNPVHPQNQTQSANVDDDTENEEEKGELKALEGEVIGILEIE